MKVKVEVTLDINAEAWAAEYGIAPTQVREDVKHHVADTARDFVNSLGLLTEGY